MRRPSYLREVVEAPDHIFRNVGGRFENVTPDIVAARGASHGVQWADFDRDGDLDLALANNNDAGAHPLYRNQLPEARARRSIQVLVVDNEGRHTRTGSEVRIFEAGTRRVVGARLVDTGGGYCSQNVQPVHVGLSEGVDAVDVEVTTLGSGERHITLLENVDPLTVLDRVLVVRTP